MVGIDSVDRLGEVAIYVAFWVLLMWGWRRKFAPDRLRALVEAQRAYDRQFRGRGQDVAAVEQRFRRMAVAGTVGITISLLVTLLIDLFLFE